MSFLKVHPREKHFRFLREVSGLLSGEPGSLSHELNTLVQNGDYRSLLEFQFDYMKGYSAEDYENARQIVALVEKQDYLDVGWDRKSEALKTFYRFEEKCRETNERLDLPCRESDVSAVLHYASRKIGEILSDVPSLDQLDFFFGPGATTNVKGREACYKAKLSARMSCSDEMLPYVSEFLEEFPLWAEAHKLQDTSDGVVVPVDVSCGVVKFVPKNSKTYRSICIEPILNGLCQKGIGSYMKRRLKKFGVDLYDQTRNQSLARQGSKDGSLATIDLSSASDSVSIGLVFNLLPLQWSEFLSRYRTGMVECDGKLLQLEKFSSMGNGFTFELESLIFFGLLCGIHAYKRQIGEVADNYDPVLGVYGDDLILPSSYFSLVEKVMSYCGFQINPHKSFCIGPFRESCGADYFLGSEIRPFYLRKKISDHVLYTFHNWAIRNCKRELAALILTFTDARTRLFGPSGYGDGHLIGSFILLRPRRIVRSGWEGGYFKTRKLLPAKNNRSYLMEFLLPSYTASCGASKEGPYDASIARGSQGCVTISVYTRVRGIFIP